MIDAEKEMEEIITKDLLKPILSKFPKQCKNTNKVSGLSVTIDIGICSECKLMKNCYFNKKLLESILDVNK